MKKIRDPMTGAIKFELTPEEIEKKKIIENIKNLEKRIKILENIVLNNLESNEGNN